jgi:TonB family protein
MDHSSLHQHEVVLESEQNQKIKRFILISASLHVGLILFLVIKSVVAPSQPKEYLPSLRVDLVALPDRKVNDPVEPAPTVAPEPSAAPAVAKEEPKTKPDIKPETDKGDMSVKKPDPKKKKEKSKKEKAAQEKMKQALARIKAIERIKAMTGEPIKGNQVSKGSAITGEAKIALETSYIDLVRERIVTYWELPKWLKDQNLSANVQVFIDRKGQMTRYQFIKPSGNEQFDNEVKRTIQAASPFPVPPSELISDLSSDGIIYRFPM